MNLLMWEEALQPCTQGCSIGKFPFNTSKFVPKNQWNGVSNTNYEDQENQHPQPTTPNSINESTSATNHNNITIIHLVTIIVQSSTTTNKQHNASKWSRWTNQQIENAMDVVEKGHMSLRKASRYWNILLTSFS